MTKYHETFDDPSYGADGAIAFFSYISSRQERGPTAFRNIVVQDNVIDSANGLSIFGCYVSKLKKVNLAFL